MASSIGSVYSADTRKPGGLPPIRFPGPFVSLQGLAGDGIVNTITEEPHGLARAMDRREGLAVADFAQAPQKVHKVLDRWRRENKQRANKAWKKWAEDAAKTPRSPEQKHDFYQAIVRQESATRWWIHKETACLASFEALPDLDKEKFKPNGWIAPGTAIWGEELYTLLNPAILPDCDASVDLNQTRRVLPSQNPWTGTHKLFPWNRGSSKAGEILVMKYRVLQSEEYAGQELEGFCVFSIDGYPFFNPGHLDDYAENFADPNCWYWKVVKAGGIKIDNVLVPYGSLVQVEERFRLRDSWRYQIVAHVWKESKPRRYYRQVEGWLEEDVHSKTILPLPLAAPVLYEIVIPGGTKISTTENEKRFFAREHGLLTITKRTFFDRRVNSKSSERLYAAGCGWISAKRRKGYWAGHEIVMPIVIDKNFDPRNPEAFHYHYVRSYLLEEQPENMPPAAIDGSAQAFCPNHSDISEQSNESSGESDASDEVPSDETLPSQDDAAKQAGSAGCGANTMPTNGSESKEFSVWL